MKCAMCGAAEASVHLTQVADGKVRSVHLCEACARKSGINIENPMSLSDLFFGLGLTSASAAGGASTPPPNASRACPSCGGTLVEFKTSGRLGCPTCYSAFETELEDLIRQMHRGDRHVGRRPAVAAAAAEEASGETVEQLQQQLEQAVAEEQYEDAARLRDRIAALRGGTTSHSRAKDTP